MRVAMGGKVVLQLSKISLLWVKVEISMPIKNNKARPNNIDFANESLCTGVIFRS
jgi:hypothetical protein